MELYLYSQYTFLSVLLIKDPDGLQYTHSTYIWLQTEVTKTTGGLFKELALYNQVNKQPVDRQSQEQCTRVLVTYPSPRLPHSSPKVHINVILLNQNIKEH